MRCLITGGTGFVGRAVASCMRAKGLDVDILGRTAAPNQVQADLTAGPPELPQHDYDVVFHAAGHAHVVPRSDNDRHQFFLTNRDGTKHLLSALERQDRMPDAFVLISTVAVYGREIGELLDEDTPREAHDAYGLSKRQAEDLVLEWGELRGVRTGVVRLPLVSGPAAHGNLGAMIDAMRRRRYAGIGDGSARRSVVDVGDVAQILNRVAAIGGIYHLTDGVHPSFREIESAIASALDCSLPPRIPLRVARLGAAVGDAVSQIAGAKFPLTSRTLQKMTSTLTFDDSRARRMLGWAPMPVLKNACDWCERAV